MASAWRVFQGCAGQDLLRTSSGSHFGHMLTMCAAVRGCRARTCTQRMGLSTLPCNKTETGCASCTRRTLGRTCVLVLTHAAN